MLIWRMLCAGVALTLIVWASSGVGLVASEAMAMEAAPADVQIDCRKTKNKEKPECKASAQSGLSDDQLYQAAYFLAQNGKYQDAITQLKQAKNQQDPRILNYLGYTTRRLGRVDEALGYYKKALEINPDYTLARAYMGEAFLEQDKPELARAQLSEIEKRCGTSCVEFTELDGQIKSFEKTGRFKPQGKIDPAVPSAG